MLRKEGLIVSKDQIFNNKMESVGDFNFGESVAAVFDDMLNRSVPFYQEIQRMIAEMVIDFAADGTHIYDLGCSTGTTLLNLERSIGNRVKYIGIDNSEEMLEKCRKNLSEKKFSAEYELVCADLNKGIHIENASVVLIVLTLQFIRPLYREKLIESIYHGMNDNACLIVVEKVIGEDSLFNRLFIKYYYDMKKRNGYSEMEISQKREALENVLIPYKFLENRELLLNQGFRYCDVFFKWYNFSGMIAVK
jgi:tRNA (cmo5U34)-methyltransferase